MAGNSQRRGRRTTPKQGAPAGSGGKRRAGLAGKGPTPPAEQRLWHKAYSGTDPVPKRTAWKQEKERRAAAAAGRPPRVGTPGSRGTPGTASQPGRGVRGPGRGDSPELVAGRNPVVEALRAQIPATALYVASGIDLDERVNELVRTAADRGIAILEVSRAELDRLTGGVPHQGVGLQVPPYPYLPFEDLLAAVVEPAAPSASDDRSDPRAQPAAPLLVALDGVTDPRNLGAVIRSAAAFGGHGVFLPERRAAGVTAAAWRTSAGAAARLPVARVTNLTRSLKACQQAGLVVVGLAADADIGLYDRAAGAPERSSGAGGVGGVLIGPLVLVVGAEGRGLSRLVGATCDLRVAIPMAADVESLNASVAAAVALAEVARLRTRP